MPQTALRQQTTHNVRPDLTVVCTAGLPVTEMLTAVDVAPAILQCSVTIVLYMPHDLQPAPLHTALQSVLTRFPTLSGRLHQLPRWDARRHGAGGDVAHGIVCNNAGVPLTEAWAPMGLDQASDGVYTRSGFGFNLKSLRNMSARPPPNIFAESLNFRAMLRGDEPLMKVKLTHLMDDDTSVLGITTAHVVTDGSAAVQVVIRLADAYRQVMRIASFKSPSRYPSSAQSPTHAMVAPVVAAQTDATARPTVLRRATASGDLATMAKVNGGTCAAGAVQIRSSASCGAAAAAAGLNEDDVHDDVQGASHHHPDVVIFVAAADGTAKPHSGGGPLGLGSKQDAGGGDAAAVAKHIGISVLTGPAADGTMGQPWWGLELTNGGRDGNGGGKGLKRAGSGGGGAAAGGGRTAQVLQAPLELVWSKDLLRQQHAGCGSPEESAADEQFARLVIPPARSPSVWGAVRSQLLALGAIKRDVQALGNEAFANLCTPVLHIPQADLAALKELAGRCCGGGDGPTFVSTNDASTALVWLLVCYLRGRPMPGQRRLPGLHAHNFYGTALDMRRNDATTQAAGGTGGSLLPSDYVGNAACTVQCRSQDDRHSPVEVHIRDRLPVYGAAHAASIGGSLSSVKGNKGGRSEAPALDSVQSDLQVALRAHETLAADLLSVAAVKVRDAVTTYRRTPNASGAVMRYVYKYVTSNWKAKAILASRYLRQCDGFLTSWQFPVWDIDFGQGAPAHFQPLMAPSAPWGAITIPAPPHAPGGGLLVAVSVPCTAAVLDQLESCPLLTALAPNARWVLPTKPGNAAAGGRC